MGGWGPRATEETGLSSADPSGTVPSSTDPSGTDPSGTDPLGTQGFLNLHKPQGISSHDCVGAVRRLVGLRRVGHGGTLDPLAVGVLPMALGRATRLLPYLPEGKAYRAVVRFGLTTTTDDLAGDILTQQPAAHLTAEAVAAALAVFKGTIEQIPPAFSAIQVQGQRLYDRARRGQAVTAPLRTVVVHQIELEGWQPGDRPEVTLAIDCGPGTYIRAIARDLGDRLGTGATLAHLVRTRSGGFDLDQALTLEQVAARAAEHRLAVVSPDLALAHLPSLVLPAAVAHRWRQGQKLPPPVDLPPAVPHRVLAEDSGEFLGVGQREDREDGPILKAKVVFQPL